MFKKMLRRSGVICALIVGVCNVAVVSCNSASSANKQEQLVVGLQSGYPPFEFRDAKGAIVGFDVDVAALLAKRLGKKLVVKDMEFEGTILSLKQGKIDLIMSGMNITPTRLKEIYMVPYHGGAATSLSLLFWGEVPQGVEKLADIAKLSKACVSVESGAIPELYMRKYKEIAVKSFHGALNPLMDVKYGKSTANLVEPDVATYLKSQHPEISILKVPLSPEDQIDGFGIGISKQNPSLCEQVTTIIEELKASGELQALEKKWFKEGEHG